MGVMVEIRHHQCPRLLTHFDLRLVVKTPVAIAQQDRKRVTRNICRNEIGKGIVIEITSRNRCRILSDFITRVVVKKIGRRVRICFGTGQQTARH